MRTLSTIIFCFLLFNCANNSKKQKQEKFTYERTQENIQKSEKDSNEVEIIINSFDSMVFDKNKIKVESGKTIILTLNHKGKIGKEFMGHNFVLLKKEIDVDNFAKRAVSAKENDYIPISDDMIAYTKMIGGGESTTIKFLAPEPGNYIYICSFPGHYMMMRGEFLVT